MSEAPSDPYVHVANIFKDALGRAFGDEYRSRDPMLRRSQHADFQVDVALSLAKALGKPPRDVAKILSENLPKNDVVERTEIAGPGFINLWLTDRFLNDSLKDAHRHSGGIPKTGQPETVVVDYSSPNVAKEMHVGHLRSTVIGDALARVLEAVGHRVIRQNHIGDWGTPFGMLIEHLLDSGVGTADKSVRDLSSFYQGARAKFDNDPAFAERARNRVVQLQAGDPETLKLWRELVNASRSYFASVYSLLNVTLSDSDIAGESTYNDVLPGLVSDLQKAGLAVESDGAICVFPPDFVGRDKQPLPLILRKQDGGYGYATTDLAAIRHRTEALRATNILYVVGAPQAQHLAMVFKVAEMAGWLTKGAAKHVAFGSVLGSDKKMFKTRAGESVRLIDLLNEGVSRSTPLVAQKNPEADEATIDSIARAVGIGAVKYADLSSDRVKDYVFDWDRMLGFDGNTGPYLQYAHARIRSILRKAGGSEPTAADALVIKAPEERALALKLLAFPSTVALVAGSLTPHILCNFTYELATLFSTFYERCPVLKADSDAERRSRLALCELTAQVLERALHLLGMQAPERM